MLIVSDISTESWARSARGTCIKNANNALNAKLKACKTKKGNKKKSCNSQARASHKAAVKACS